VGRLDLRDPVRDEGVPVRKTDAFRGRELSAAELEVIAGAASGESQERTAKRTGKSVETIKTQRRLAISKLGARNMTNAVAIAAAQGLIDVSKLGLAAIMAEISRALAVGHLDRAFTLLTTRVCEAPVAAAFLLANGAQLDDLPASALDEIALARRAGLP
jgi:DNA-binding CsgD family transcriptional regulator